MDRSLAIGGVLYEIISPSVRNVSLAQEYLKELPEGNNLKEIFSQLDKERLCKILSCFIKGDLSLVDKLKEDSKEILVDILSIEYEDYRTDIKISSYFKMKITSDLSGIDKFVQDVRDELKQKMIDIAHEGVQQAKDKGEYKNHTYNLRSAPGAAVVLDGKIEDMYVPAETGHNEAKVKTENLLLYGNRPQNGIMLADGMEYASFVESKGFDVISKPAISIKNNAEKEFSK